MAPRKDYAVWTPAEDDYLAARLREGWTARKIAANWPPQYPRRNVNSINNRKASLGLRVAKEVHTEATPEQTVDVQDQGDSITIRAAGTRIRTLDDLLKHVEADLTTFEVDRPTFRKNEMAVRDHHGKLNLVEYFHVSCTLKRKAGPSTQEQVEAVVKGLCAKHVRVHTAKLPNTAKLNADLLQSIIIADPHLAKYAYSGETGWADYDLAIGAGLVEDGGEYLTDWGDTYKPAERHIYLLGDVLHYDTPHGTTTGGTPQDRDTRVYKMLETAGAVLARLIERSAATARTTVYLVPGNHDRVLTYALQLALALRFERDPRVTVDTGATHRKYVEWGACLIGLTHGDTARKRLPSLMQVEQREAWGRSRVREWHHGHLHREAQTVTEAGVTIREHLALCPPDGWHAREGYVGSPRGMDSYLYSREGRVQGFWRFPVLEG
jgi:hypothetical protein